MSANWQYIQTLDSLPNFEIRWAKVSCKTYHSKINACNTLNKVDIDDLICLFGKRVYDSFKTLVSFNGLNVEN
jgi:hypothetical protein